MALGWPPTTLAPAGPFLGTVVVNGIYPILDQDVLTPHQSPTTNIGWLDLAVRLHSSYAMHLWYVRQKTLRNEHPRKLTALTKTVYAMGLAMGKVADPLSPPCLSVISRVVKTYS